MEEEDPVIVKVDQVLVTQQELEEGSVTLSFSFAPIVAVPQRVVVLRTRSSYYLSVAPNITSVYCHPLHYLVALLSSCPSRPSARRPKSRRVRGHGSEDPPRR